MRADFYLAGWIQADAVMTPRMERMAGDRRRGRPRDAAKADAVLNAAHGLFVRHGYRGVSMDAIADAAGVSKATVYVHYGTKQRLCEQVVAQALDWHLKPLDALILDPSRLEPSLRTFGRSLADVLFHPDYLGLYRLVAAAGQPAICECMRARGICRMRDRIVRLLSENDRFCALDNEDLARLAAQYLSLFATNAFLQALYQLPRRTSDEARTTADQALDFFLLACRRGD